MPNNLDGPGDNYDLNNSHVLPALIRKFQDAKARREGVVTLWGTGAPLREFLHSDDMAAACVFLMDLDDHAFDPLLHPDVAKVEPPLVNIGSGEELTIRELAEKVRNVVGFNGSIRWDTTKPDGTPRKLLDPSRLFALGWRPRIPLEQGIAAAYEDFLARSS